MNRKLLLFPLLFLGACSTDVNNTPVTASKEPSGQFVSKTDSRRVLTDLEHYELRARSPDGRFAVTVPIVNINKPSIDGENIIIEARTGEIIAKLPGDLVFTHKNHGGGDGVWSKDGKLLLWVAHGKWTTGSVVAVKFSGTDVEWMHDLSPPCQKAILEKTKAADPVAYAREKEWNKGSGRAYPEGFTVDVRTGDVEGEEPHLPLKVRVDLTSNPKGNADADGIQHQGIDAWLDATLDEHGVLTFGKFEAKRRPGLKNTWSD